MAEFVSVHPVAGGQYYWVSKVSPPRIRPLLTFFTGWLSVGGWIAMNATGPLLASQLIVSLIALFDQSYQPQNWHSFLMYLGFSAMGFLMNMFATFTLPTLSRLSFYWAMLGLGVIVIVLLAAASPHFATGAWVFGGFENTTGWPDGFAWLLGLLLGSFGLSSSDTTAHMIEEIPDPRRTGPRVMVYSVLIGIASSFLLLVVLLFVSNGAGNFDAIMNSRQTPLIKIFSIATRSRAGTVCLTLFPLMCLVFTIISLFTASSRMVYAFARDDGLPWSNFFAHMDPHRHAPLNALYASLAGVVVFGCVYVGSSSAFEAIESASVIWLDLSYVMPVACNMAYRRRALPPGPFHMKGIVGWAANIIGLSYVLLTTVLFLFPAERHPDASSMNYSVVAFAILILLCMGWWLVSARHTFTGQVQGVEDDCDNTDLAWVDEKAARL